MKSSMNLFAQSNLTRGLFLNPEKCDLKKNNSYELSHLVPPTSYFVPEISCETGDFNAI